MIIKTEKCLCDFDFWSGARSTADCLSSSDYDIIEETLDELYPDGCDDTFVNDLFWFDKDIIASWLGFSDWDDFLNTRFPNSNIK